MAELKLRSNLSDSLDESVIQEIQFYRNLNIFAVIKSARSSLFLFRK